MSLIFSHTTEYALRAMVYLAINASTSQTAQRVADGTGVPTGYLSKVLMTLIRAGFVRSQRGLGGGYTLALAPSRISILDVVNVFDPIVRVMACPMKLADHDRLCPLHRHLDGAATLIQHMFSATMLADLVHENQDCNPICGITASPPSSHPSTQANCKSSGD